MSGFLSTVSEAGVARISLENGRGNPLTPDLLVALDQRLAELAEGGVRALVLDAGEARIFSGGFALPIIAPYERPQLRAFFDGFCSVLNRVLTFPAPSIVAVGGHAVAGGFILTTAFDLRVVTRAPIKLGLSEVDLGVAVPAGARTLLEARTSPQVARRWAMTGKLVGPEEALAAGYADELADDPTARALEWAETLALKPGQGVAETRRIATAALAERVRAEDDAWMEPFLDTWFSDVGQKIIGAMAAKLSGR